MAARLRGEVAEARAVWCVFGNMADFHAVDDVLALRARLSDEKRAPKR